MDIRPEALCRVLWVFGVRGAMVGDFSSAGTVIKAMCAVALRDAFAFQTGNARTTHRMCQGCRTNNAAWTSKHCCSECTMPPTGPISRE